MTAARLGKTPTTSRRRCAAVWALHGIPPSALRGRRSTASRLRSMGRLCGPPSALSPRPYPSRSRCPRPSASRTWPTSPPTTPAPPSRVCWPTLVPPLCHVSRRPRRRPLRRPPAQAAPLPRRLPPRPWHRELRLPPPPDAAAAFPALSRPRRWPAPLAQVARDLDLYAGSETPADLPFPVPKTRAALERAAPDVTWTTASCDADQAACAPSPSTLLSLPLP